MEKTLLTPLERGTPRHGRDMPKRNATSYRYQDEAGRYFLGAYPAPAITPHSTDVIYILEAGDVARPDMISYKFYQTPTLYWVILWVNNILDPFEGMYPGMMLRIPSKMRLIDFNIQG